MKTPLTQLIDTLKAIRDNAPYIQRSAYTKAINEAKELLQKEEDVIKNAWSSGWLNWDDIDSAKDYFNSTYPKPETQGEE